jgi:hypothetical protein
MKSPVKKRSAPTDEMGLGKTVQALGIAAYFAHEWPLLIVCPASLRFVWVAEIEQWMRCRGERLRVQCIKTGKDLPDPAAQVIVIR